MDERTLTRDEYLCDVADGLYDAGIDPSEWALSDDPAPEDAEHFGLWDDGEVDF